MLLLYISLDEILCCDNTVYGLVRFRFRLVLPPQTSLEVVCLIANEAAKCSITTITWVHIYKMLYYTIKNIYGRLYKL